MGALLTETARATGLDRGLRSRLAPWRAARAMHQPGKVLLDLATAVVLGGDCLADVGIVLDAGGAVRSGRVGPDG